MSNKPENLVDLAFSAGPPPQDVALATWLIASLPPKSLSKAARSEVPAYEDLLRDMMPEQNGPLIKYMQENPMPELKIATDVISTQQELSKTRRRLATVMCSLALFAAGTGYDYHVITKDLGVATSTVDRIERAAILGIPAGALGGIVTMFVGLSQAGRLARRPAQDIINRAKRGTLDSDR